MTSPTIALAHDYITQRGGAERVVLCLANRLHGTPIHTAVYNPPTTYPEFKLLNVRPSHLQHIPLFRQDPRYAFPLLFREWRNTTSEADITIASSSGWAHAVRTRPAGLKVVYCHNPPRWLYQPGDYFRSAAARSLFGAFIEPMKKRDRQYALEADLYLANSSVVAQRIDRYYGIDATVVHPPTTIDSEGDQQVMPISPGYWLTISRGRGYKNTHEIIQAVEQDWRQRLVIVGPIPPGARNSSSVKWCGVVSDSQLRWLYANARALVSVSHEDFGLTPLEANSFGTPSLVLRAGGFLDTLHEGVSGAGVDEPSAAAVLDGMQSFAEFDRQAIIAHANRFAPDAFFHKILKIVKALRQRDCSGVATWQDM